MEYTNTLKQLLCILDTAAQIVRHRGTGDLEDFDRAKAAAETTIDEAVASHLSRDEQAAAFRDAVAAATRLAAQAEPDSQRRLEAAILVCRHYNGDDR